MPIRLVTIHPDGERSERRYEKRPTLEDLQAAVGGYVEHVKVKYKGKIRDAYVNEDGKLKNLPFNEAATGYYIEAHRGFVVDYIVGPLVIEMKEKSDG